EIWRGHLNEAAAWAGETAPRGEIALVVQGALPPGPADEADVEAAVQARLDAGDSARDAATTVAADLGVPKRQAYAVANRLA
ncbi:MAG TPA: hypothetical protein VFP02_01135, partial [Acidimicrobiales bacterium]|nr:hypothetical protein [Acidimicrobiales bacterium]